MNHSIMHSYGIFGTKVGLDILKESGTIQMEGKKGEFLRYIGLPTKYFLFKHENDNVIGITVVNFEGDAKKYCAITYYSFARDYVNRRGYFGTYVLVELGVGIKNIKKLLDYLRLTSEAFRKNCISSNEQITENYENFNLYDTHALGLFSKSYNITDSNNLSRKFDKSSSLTGIFYYDEVEILKKMLYDPVSNSKHRFKRVFIPSSTEIINNNNLSFGNVKVFKGDKIHIFFSNVSEKPEVGEHRQKETVKDDSPSEISEKNNTSDEPQIIGVANEGNKDNTENIEDEIKKDDETNNKNKIRQRLNLFKNIKLPIPVRRILIILLILLFSFVSLISLVMYIKSTEIGKSRNKTEQPNSNQLDNILSKLEKIDIYTDRNKYIQKEHNKHLNTLRKMRRNYDFKELNLEKYLNLREEKLTHIKEEYNEYNQLIREVRNCFNHYYNCRLTNIEDYSNKLSLFTEYQDENRDVIQKLDKLILEGQQKYIDKSNFFQAAVTCSENRKYEYLPKDEWICITTKYPVEYSVQDIAKEVLKKSNNSFNNEINVSNNIIRYNPCDIDPNYHIVRGNSGEKQAIVIYLMK